MQIYDKLLGMPMFLGMSSSDLQDVVTRVRFGFHKIGNNERVITEGDRCTNLMFLIGGEMSVISEAADHSYNVKEIIKAPSALQPECIFGLTQRYTKNFETITQCNLLSIPKDDVMLLSDEFLVFRLNLLNIISTHAQRQSRQIWQHRPEGIRGRIIRFLRSHSTYPAGKKVFHIKMQTLADEINDSRLDVSCALKDLAAEGLLISQRGMITVPQLEKLL